MANGTHDTAAIPPNRWRIPMWGAATFLWLLPLLAMQFTKDVVWTALDFEVWGAMLLVACVTYEFAARLSASTTYRGAVAIALGAAFLLVWITLAVGIIGSERHPANLMFLCLLVAGIVGAFVARGQPAGMARAMIAMAAAQAVVGLVTLRDGLDLTVWALTAFFGAAWLASACLFHHAALERAR